MEESVVVPGSGLSRGGRHVSQPRLSAPVMTSKSFRTTWVLPEGRLFTTELHDEQFLLLQSTRITRGRRCRGTREANSELQLHARHTPTDLRSQLRQMKLGFDSCNSRTVRWTRPVTVDKDITVDECDVFHIFIPLKPNPCPSDRLTPTIRSL